MIHAPGHARYTCMERDAKIVATARTMRNVRLSMEPAFVRRDTEVRIVAKRVLKTLTARIVHKIVLARMVPPVQLRLADATVQQVTNCFTIISKVLLQLTRTAAIVNNTPLVFLLIVYYCMSNSQLSLTVVSNSLINLHH